MSIDAARQAPIDRLGLLATHRDRTRDVIGPFRIDDDIGIRESHLGMHQIAGSDKEAARQQIYAACRKFLTNPVIEDFHLEIVD